MTQTQPQTQPQPQPQTQPQSQTTIPWQNMTLDQALQQAHTADMLKKIDQLSSANNQLVPMTKQQLQQYCIRMASAHNELGAQQKANAYQIIARKLRGEDVDQDTLVQSLELVGQTNDAVEKAVAAKLKEEANSFWDRKFLGLSARAWAWIIGGLIVGGLCYGAFRKGGWLNKDKKKTTSATATTVTPEPAPTMPVYTDTTLNTTTNDGSTLGNAGTVVNGLNNILGVDTSYQRPPRE